MKKPSRYYAAKDEHSGRLCGHRHRTIRVALKCSCIRESNACTYFLNESWDMNVVCVEAGTQRKLTDAERRIVKQYVSFGVVHA